VEGLRIKVKGARFGVQGSGVQGFKVQRFRGQEFKVKGVGFRV
jgi:hypothetical protein